MELRKYQKPKISGPENGAIRQVELEYPSPADLSLRKLKDGTKNLYEESAIAPPTTETNDKKKAGTCGAIKPLSAETDNINDKGNAEDYAAQPSTDYIGEILEKIRSGNSLPAAQTNSNLSAAKNFENSKNMIASPTSDLKGGKARTENSHEKNQTASTSDSKEYTAESRREEESENNSKIVKVKKPSSTSPVSIESKTKSSSNTSEALFVGPNIKTSSTKITSADAKTSREKSSGTKTKQKNIHKDHRKRLKSQFVENGLNSLTDIQKLELLLFYAQPLKDTNPISHNLIDEFGSIQDVFKADYDVLLKVPGVKENTAMLIKMVSQFLPVILHRKPPRQINASKTAKEFCKQFYIGVPVEQFYVICLNKDNLILKYKMIESGTSDEVSVQIRSVTEAAINAGSSRIIISHNHPNSSSNMSDEDCSFTYSLICSCLLNSIELLDHIIVSPTDVTSMAEKRVLPKLKEHAFRTLSVPITNMSLLSSVSTKYKLST